MALTRKMLKAMGIEDEKIDQIIEAHGETVDALKEDRDKYKATAEKLPGVQEELDALKAKGDDGYKEKFESVTKELEELKANAEKEKTHAAKVAAYRNVLKAAGISEKRIDTILKVSDVDALELDESGAVADAEERTKAAQTEWADFVEHTETKGTETANPPANNPANVDLGSLSMEEYIAARKKG